MPPLIPSKVVVTGVANNTVSCDRPDREVADETQVGSSIAKLETINARRYSRLEHRIGDVGDSQRHRPVSYLERQSNKKRLPSTVPANATRRARNFSRPWNNGLSDVTTAHRSVRLSEGDLALTDLPRAGQPYLSLDSSLTKFNEAFDPLLVKGWGDYFGLATECHEVASRLHVPASASTSKHHDVADYVGSMSRKSIIDKIANADSVSHGNIVDHDIASLAAVSQQQTAHYARKYDASDIRVLDVKTESQSGCATHGQRNDPDDSKPKLRRVAAQIDLRSAKESSRRKAFSLEITRPPVETLPKRRFSLSSKFKMFSRGEQKHTKSSPSRKTSLASSNDVVPSNTLFKRFPKFTHSKDGSMNFSMSMNSAIDASKDLAGPPSALKTAKIQSTNNRKTKRLQKRSTSPSLYLEMKVARPKTCR